MNQSNRRSYLVLACLIGGATCAAACGADPVEGEEQSSVLGATGQAPPTAANVNSGPHPSTSNDPQQAHADCLSACKAAGESPSKCQAGCDLGRAQLVCYSGCVNIGHDKDLCETCFSGETFASCFKACTAGGGGAQQCTDGCVGQHGRDVCYWQCLKQGGGEQSCRANCYV